MFMFGKKTMTSGWAPRATLASLTLLGAVACLQSLPAHAQSDESQGGAQAQVGAQTSSDFDDEPGRVSSEHVVITDGPYRRQEVDFHTSQPPGTIIIRTQDKFLYLVLGDNRAMRYGIGVGRVGFRWSGTVNVTRKAEWPDWTPPAAMISRQPYLPRFMAGGTGNPLGARAMYLGSTEYRIHGTNQPETIGTSVSSGCFRLANGDVVDLFSRVKVGAKVIIQQGGDTNNNEVATGPAASEEEQPN
jgi:lipoprotein-anchoring transpeptidase ErfK/SrfK